MTDECPYYKMHRSTLKSGEIGNPSTQTTEQPYCDEPNHSPFPKRRAMRGAVGQPLSCGGSLAKCPIIDKIGN